MFHHHRRQSSDEFEILPLPGSPSQETPTITSGQATPEISVVNGNLDDESSSLVPDHEYSSSSSGFAQEVLSSKRSNHRVRYLPAWEKRAEAQYKTYVFDGFGASHEKLLC
jgi:hypothetical protein